MVIFNYIPIYHTTGNPTLYLNRLNILYLSDERVGNLYGQVAKILYYPKIILFCLIFLYTNFLSKCIKVYNSLFANVNIL